MEFHSRHEIKRAGIHENVGLARQHHEIGKLELGKSRDNSGSQMVLDLGKQITI